MPASTFSCHRYHRSSIIETINQIAVTYLCKWISITKDGFVVHTVTNNKYDYVFLLYWINSPFFMQCVISRVVILSHLYMCIYIYVVLDGWTERIPCTHARKYQTMLSDGEPPIRTSFRKGMKHTITPKIGTQTHTQPETSTHIRSFMHIGTQSMNKFADRSWGLGMDTTRRIRSYRLINNVKMRTRLIYLLADSDDVVEIRKQKLGRFAKGRLTTAHVHKYLCVSRWMTKRFECTLTCAKIRHKIICEDSRPDTAQRASTRCFTNRNCN